MANHDNKTETRHIDLHPEFDRNRAENTETIVLDCSEIALASFKDAFLRNYSTIKAKLKSQSDPGITIIASDGSRIISTAFIKTKENNINTAIAGRHSKCDLYLPDDATISLRHLLIISYPKNEKASTRIRLLDLRTSSGTYNEKNERIEALEADGPVFLSLGRYLVFIFVENTDSFWTEDALSAWEEIPERVYLREKISTKEIYSEERSINNKYSRARSDKDKADSNNIKSFKHPTLIQALSGPIRAKNSLVASNKKPFSKILIRSDKGLSTILVGRQSLEEGVLFGRYERCDNEGIKVLSHRRISRVHLIIIMIENTPYAIDAASTNQIWVGKKSKRLIPLTHEKRIILGKELAQIEWITL